MTTLPTAVIFRPSSDAVVMGFISPYNADFVDMARNFPGAWFEYEKRTWHFPADSKDAWIRFAGQYWDIMDTTVAAPSGIAKLVQNGLRDVEYQRGYKAGAASVQDELQVVRGRLERAQRAYRELQEQTRRQEMFRPRPAAASPNSSYRVLEVMDGASKDVCEAAYKTLSRRYHPDTGGSHEKMVQLNRAIEELRKRW